MLATIHFDEGGRGTHSVLIEGNTRTSTNEIKLRVITSVVRRVVASLPAGLVDDTTDDGAEKVGGDVIGVAGVL